MEYVRDITLSFTPSGSIPVIRVKQGDSFTRFIRVTLLDGDDIFIPGAEHTVLFREEKPDGHGVLTDSDHLDLELGRYLVVKNGDGSVTVELTTQCTTCVGFCKCDICMLDGGRLISSAPFLLEVEAAPNISGSAVSSDDFRTLINALHDVDLSSTTELGDMNDVALESLLHGQIIVYDASAQKWKNKNITDYGYQTSQNVKDTVEAYGYQTATQVNSAIEQYVSALDANNVRY